MVWTTITLPYSQMWLTASQTTLSQRSHTRKVSNSYSSWRPSWVKQICKKCSKAISTLTHCNQLTTLISIPISTPTSTANTMTLKLQQLLPRLTGKPGYILQDFLHKRVLNLLPTVLLKQRIWLWNILPVPVQPVQQSIPNTMDGTAVSKLCSSSSYLNKLVLPKIQWLWP